MIKEVKYRSRTALREKMAKSGAKAGRHGRTIVFQPARVAMPKRLFREIFQSTDELRARPAPVWAEEFHGAVWNDRRAAAGR